MLGYTANTQNGSGSESSTGLEKEIVHELLSSSRRIEALRIIDIDGPLELDELAERVAAQEFACTVSELTSQQRKRVYVSLYQAHLPKLKDANVVTENRKTIEKAENFEQVAWYLENSPHDSLFSNLF